MSPEPLGGIWLIPLYFNAKGILYVELFGNNDASEIESSPQQSSFFDA